MRSIQTNPMIFMSDRLSIAFSFSRRAHLLTTPKGRWYFLRKSCALRGGCSSCGRRWTRLHFCQTASLAHAVGAGDSILESPVHGVVYCHPIPPPACVNLPLAALHRYRGVTNRSTPAGGTSHFTTYLLESGAEEGLLHFTVTLRKGW